MPEADLYGPIKQFLEAQGFAVKGEIGPCDVVAVRGEEGLVVVELKERLTLALVLQAVYRLAVSDAVYVAFSRRGGGHGRVLGDAQEERAGSPSAPGARCPDSLRAAHVVSVLDPAPYRPRSNARRRDRLLKEFAECVGNPEAGGSVSRQRLTAYHQDAVRCAQELAAGGAFKVSAVRERTGVSRAGSILRDNHYGWFDRVKRGHYALTPKVSEICRTGETCSRIAIRAQGRRIRP